MLKTIDYNWTKEDDKKLEEKSIKVTNAIFNKKIKKNKKGGR